MFRKKLKIFIKNQGCLEKIKHKYDKNKIAKKNSTKVQQNQGCQKLNKVITKNQGCFGEKSFKIEQRYLKFEAVKKN